MEVALTRINPEYLHLLTEDDRMHIAKKKTFIGNATLEQKLLLLAKIGYPFVITVLDRKKKFMVSYVERIIKFFFKALSFHKKQATFILKDHSFFFLADIDVVRSMMLSANMHNSSTNQYRISAEKIHELKNRSVLFTRNLAAAQDLDEMITKAVTLGANAQKQDQFLALHKICFKKYLILAHISKHREANRDNLTKRIGLHIKNELAEMVQDKMIESKREISTTNYSDDMNYWLTGYGELLLMKARNYFL
jgi:uncharacterized protein YdcH (DUF465 family)